MMPRPIGRGIIDLAVDLLSAYLNPTDLEEQLPVVLAQQ